MKTKKGILFTVLAACFFGLSAAMAPLTYEEGGCTPVMLTMLRLAVCLPFLLIFARYQKISLPVTQQQGGKLFLLGAVGMGASTLLLNSSFTMMDAGIASTLHFTYPIFVLLGGVLFYRERISKGMIFAMVISLAGILCFMGQGNGVISLSGVGVAVISGVCYAFYLLYLDKSGMSALHPVKANLYIMIAAMAALAVFALFSGQMTIASITPASWILIFLSGCSSLTGMLLIQTGIQYTDSTTASILSTFEPVTCTIGGILWLGEGMTISKLAGCVLVLSGVIILTFWKGRQEKKTDPI